MDIKEMEVRTISLCIAALQARDAETMRRALVKILEDRNQMFGNFAKNGFQYAEKSLK